MAVSTITPTPPSQPDVSKLNGFSGHTVTVTKHMAPRNTTGQLVVPTQPMALKQILELMTSVPMQYGPGFYQFVVVDSGGQGEDKWMVKLGPDIAPQESFMAGPNGTTPTNGFAGAGAQTLGEGVIHLGHGFYYNEAMGTLTTPWRAIVSWKQGDAMPVAPVSANAAVPQSTPWGQQQPWGAPGGWGGYPVNDGVEAKLKTVEAQLVEERQRRREDDQRVAMERMQAETRQMVADSNARFEKIIEKLATKPTGDDPALAAIKAQNEQLQRQSEQDRRDREARERETAFREEMRRNKEDTDRMIAALSANKSDPMLTMMMQMMQQANANGMESIKAIQASTTAASTASERQNAAALEQLRNTIMNPMQLIQMLQAARSDGSDATRLLTENMKNLMDTQRSVFEQLLDVAGQGSQPAWLQAIQTAMDKIGPIGEALVNRAKQPQVVVQRVPVYTPPPPQNAALSGAPGVAPAPGPTSAQFKPGGGMPEPIVTPTEVAKGARPEPIVTPTDPVQPAQTAATVEVLPPVSGKKGKRGRKDKATPGRGPTIAELREMDPDEIEAAVSAFGDDTFFGPILPSVVQLRGQVAAGMPAEKAAEVLLQARPHIVNLQPMPAAAELLMAEQFDVLVGRVLPDVDDDYHEAVVSKIEAQYEIEAGGADEE